MVGIIIFWAIKGFKPTNSVSPLTEVVGSRFSFAQQLIVQVLPYSTFFFQVLICSSSYSSGHRITIWTCFSSNNFSKGNLSSSNGHHCKNYKPHSFSYIARRGQDLLWRATPFRNKSNAT